MKIKATYKLFPFYFSRIPYSASRVLITNDGGEFLFIKYDDLLKVIKKEYISFPLYSKLYSRSFIYEDDYIQLNKRLLSSKIKTRKSFIIGGPALHIFVVTLRCHNSCDYCQVTRKNISSSNYDMSISDAEKFIDIMFQSPSDTYTIEFQGGEPLLNIKVIKHIIYYTKLKNIKFDKKLHFVIATTLFQVNEEILNYLHEENVYISTSLDGPEILHNQNRINNRTNNYKETLKGINLARKILGDEKVSAMTTITRNSLKYAKEIIDEYISMDFRSIFLRPLNDYGYAAKRRYKIGYSAKEFEIFYQEAINYIIEYNKKGVVLDEVNATLALTNILTHNNHGYVDLRSPCGDGTGVLVYNYDGLIYPSDEARMLKEMGDSSLVLGTSENTYDEIMQSDVLKTILTYGISEGLTGCSDCVYLPYCGAHPVSTFSSHADFIGYRNNNSFCLYQKIIFQFIFEKLYSKDDDSIRIFYSWLNHCGIDEIPLTGYKGWVE